MSCSLFRHGRCSHGHSASSALCVVLLVTPDHRQWARQSSGSTSRCRVARAWGCASTRSDCTAFLRVEFPVGHWLARRRDAVWRDVELSCAPIYRAAREIVDERDKLGQQVAIRSRGCPVKKCPPSLPSAGKIFVAKAQEESTGCIRFGLLITLTIECSDSFIALRADRYCTKHATNFERAHSVKTFLEQGGDPSTPFKKWRPAMGPRKGAFKFAVGPWYMTKRKLLAQRYLSKLKRSWRSSHCCHKSLRHFPRKYVLIPSLDEVRMRQRAFLGGVHGRRLFWMLSHFWICLPHALVAIDVHVSCIVQKPITRVSHCVRIILFARVQRAHTTGATGAMTNRVTPGHGATGNISFAFSPGTKT